MAKKGVTARGDYGPAVTAEKIGNQVTIRFNNFGICKTFYVDNPEAELRKITWYGAAYKDHFHTENNVLRALHVIKHNVERYEDIPNYFSNGDIVEIDGASGSVYINDAYDTDVADIGSQPLLLPPGQHTLGIITSSFAVRTGCGSHISREVDLMQMVYYRTGYACAVYPVHRFAADTSH